MAKPWDSTFARLVDKKMTPDPKRVALDLNGDPIALNPIMYDVRETRTPTGRIIREPVFRGYDFGVSSAASPRKEKSKEEIVREIHKAMSEIDGRVYSSLKREMFGITYGMSPGRAYGIHPDLDYRKDEMYNPKPKFQNTQEGRQKERLYGKKPEISAKEANEWLASLPPVEPVW